MTETQILIVEDESIVALDLKVTLSRLGYDVPAVVDSGEEAIQCAAEMCPDLVLMDIRLKGTMDGIEAARELGVRWDIPVVYLTAMTDEETLRRAETMAPYYGCIVKPFDERDLQRKIDNTLSQNREERA